MSLYSQRQRGVKKGDARVVERSGLRASGWGTAARASWEVLGEVGPTMVAARAATVARGAAIRSSSKVKSTMRQQPPDDHRRRHQDA